MAGGGHRSLLMLRALHPGTPCCTGLPSIQPSCVIPECLQPELTVLAPCAADLARNNAAYIIIAACKIWSQWPMPYGVS